MDKLTMNVNGQDFELPETVWHCVKAVAIERDELRDAVLLWYEYDYLKKYPEGEAPLHTKRLAYLAQWFVDHPEGGQEQQDENVPGSSH